MERAVAARERACFLHGALGRKRKMHGFKNGLYSAPRARPFASAQGDGRSRHHTVRIAMALRDHRRFNVRMRENAAALRALHNPLRHGVLEPYISLS